MVFPSADSKPTLLPVLNNALYFVARDTSGGTEQWKSKDTAAGTTLIKAFAPFGEIRSQIRNSTTLYLAVDTEPMPCNEQTELWKSKGTTTRTTLVKEVPYDALDSSLAKSEHTITLYRK